MKYDMDMRKPAWAEDLPANVEQECETWDWARTAGVSASELRQAVLESLKVAEAA